MSKAAGVVKILECKACGHNWLPRSLSTPVRCPKCQSATWQTGRRRPPRQPVEAKADA